MLGSQHSTLAIVLCSPEKAVVCDAALGHVFSIPNLTRSAAFIPNSTSFIATRAPDVAGYYTFERELYIWDIGLLMDPPAPGQVREGRSFEEGHSFQVVPVGLEGLRFTLLDQTKATRRRENGPVERLQVWTQALIARSAGHELSSSSASIPSQFRLTADWLHPEHMRVILWCCGIFQLLRRS